MNYEAQQLHPAAHTIARKTFVSRDGVHLQRGYLYLPERVWAALDDLTAQYALPNASQTVAKLVMALADEHQNSAQGEYGSRRNH